MSNIPARRRCPRAFVVLLCLVVVARSSLAQTATFATAMQDAMVRMDRDMMAAPTGDTDRDFAAMMIPHHRGAVEMAEAELRFGHDPILRRLAQAIIVEQRQEIDVMQRALAAPPTAQAVPHPHMKMVP